MLAKCWSYLVAQYYKRQTTWKSQLPPPYIVLNFIHSFPFLFRVNITFITFSLTLHIYMYSLSYLRLTMVEKWALLNIPHFELQELKYSWVQQDQDQSGIWISSCDYALPLSQTQTTCPQFKFGPQTPLAWVHSVK